MIIKCLTIIIVDKGLIMNLREYLSVAFLKINDHDQVSIIAKVEA